MSHLGKIARVPQYIDKLEYISDAFLSTYLLRLRTSSYVVSHFPHSINVYPCTR